MPGVILQSLSGCLCADVSFCVRAGVLKTRTHGDIARHRQLTIAPYVLPASEDRFYEQDCCLLGPLSWTWKAHHSIFLSE